MSNRPVRVQKRLLQFNQLPFAFGEITDPSYSIAFKGASESYTNNAHGSYFPTIGESAKLEASTFEATFSLDFRKIPCEEKVRYARFVKRELAKSGKLWAVQNAVELIWANARVISIIESISDPNARDIFTLKVQFEIIDGYWTMAKRTRTFLCDYCATRFEDFDADFCEDAYDYYGVCDTTGKSSCLPCDINLTSAPKYEGCEWKPLCYFPLYTQRNTRDANGNAIIIPPIYDFFGVNCANQKYIRYDCELEKQWFCYYAPWGRKFSLDSSKPTNKTIFDFCGRTDLPTEMVRIRLQGQFVNPTVKINGDEIRVGTTDNPVNINGIMTAGFGPEVYASLDDKDPLKGVDFEQGIGVLTNNTYRSNTPMFQIMPGTNHIEVTGNVFGSDAYLYVEPIDITW